MVYHAPSHMEVVQAELAADASSFFIAVWDTDQATLSIFQAWSGFPVIYDDNSDSMMIKCNNYQLKSSKSTK